MTKMGRPPGKNRTERLEIRLTQEEAERLKRCADALGTTRTRIINHGVVLVEQEIVNQKGIDENDAGTGIEQV